MVMARRLFATLTNFFRGIYKPPTYFGHLTKDEVLIDFVFIFQRCLLHLELSNIS